ncbi:hypothetical protein L596_002286 [Steinernema carpocapsae]|uniref:TMEM9 family protein n=1 Tax=Steinernema carpocapsae TaxID=34508 RepID=A0A4U8UPU3_STECR|nr:hypothetical protein L596_002286 [Steinernema carpocapsae]
MGPSMPTCPAILLILIGVIRTVEANFEDTRCRCVCPSTKYFSENRTEVDINHRRYYTKTNINPNVCNPLNVVKTNVIGIVDPVHLDAFLANCDCKYESRNTVMLKVVVIFVICVVVVLVTYMVILACLDPRFRHRRQSIPYRHHNDEPNTFWSRRTFSLDPRRTSPVKAARLPSACARNLTATV